MEISLEGVTLSFQMKCTTGLDLFGPVGHCSNFKKFCSWSVIAPEIHGARTGKAIMLLFSIEHMC